MATPARTRQPTLEDLYRVPGKAELVNGEIIPLPPAGEEPGYAGDEIFVALRQYVRQTGQGRAVGDKGFRVSLPHRQYFSPDAASYVGPASGMRFYEGASVVAVEVRSEGEPAVPGWTMPVDALFFEP